MKFIWLAKILKQDTAQYTGQTKKLDLISNYNSLSSKYDNKKAIGDDYANLQINFFVEFWLPIYHK
jgi:hypothetical protein